MAEIPIEKAPPRVRDMYNKAYVAFERGNLDYAIELFLSCIQMEPQLLSARKYLRAAEIKRFRKEKSSTVGDAIALVGSLPVFLKAKARIKAKKGVEALEQTELLLQKAPLNLQFVRLFTQAAVAAEMPEAAIQTLEMTRDHYPEDLWVLNWLGALYQSVGRTRSARECFEKLCEVCPNDPQALKALKDAMAVESLSKGWEQTAESGGSYRELIKDTKEAQILEQQAKAVKSEKDAEALIEDTLRKIEEEPNNGNHYRVLAGLYMQKERFEEAAASLEQALRITPGDPELDSMLSSTRVQRYDQQIRTLRNGGKTAEADALASERDQYRFENLRDRVQRYPNDTRLRFDWGQLLFARKLLNEAIQQFQLSLRNPEIRIQALYHLGVSFKLKGQFDLAAQQLEKAVEELGTMDDAKKNILYELGLLWEETGETEKASDCYKQIYQADIAFKDIADRIERVYRKQEPA